ncbi:hypothetical protein K9M50_03555 [Patescibacteria group bacterium]|nr:hypothetical protein [Patescibacteria group bacterium]
MKTKMKKIILKTFIIVFVFLFILVAHFNISPQAFLGAKLFQNTAYSAVMDNVRGFAHSSESQSWVSFNCASDPTVGGQNIFTFNFSTSSVVVEPTMYFSFPSCDQEEYGLNIDDSTGEISGKALSDHYGWIDFNHDTNPFTPKAYYNSSTKEITGTAFVERLGNPDGKVNFQDIDVDVDGFWHGHMTNGDMGNIKLNCDDSTLTSSHPECSENFFKVKYVRPLILEVLNAPNWSPAQVCSSFTNKAVLRWDSIGDAQSAYQVIIDTDSVRDDNPPHFDSGKVTSPSQQFICPGTGNDCSLDYDTTYYFWVQLWNSIDQARGWIQFDTNDTNHTLTDNEDYNNSVSPDPNLTFTTYRHDFPEPSFTWTPEEIIITEEVDFEGEADYYTDANPDSNVQACTDSTCDFVWSTTMASNISNATNSTTTIVFIESADGFVNLEVTDPDGYTCTKSEPISVSFEDPIWKEVNPEEE